MRGCAFLGISVLFSSEIFTDDVFFYFLIQSDISTLTEQIFFILIMLIQY